MLGLGKFLGKNPYLVGLDIGSCYIKILELSRAENGVALSKIGCVHLSPESIVEKDIIDFWEVSKEIKALHAIIKPSKKELAIAVSGSSVLIHFFKIPFMPEKDIPAYILENYSGAFPFKLDEVYLDFSTLKLGERGLAQVEITAAAAKRSLVDEYVRVLEQAGLKPRLVDLDALALYNAFQFSHGTDFKTHAIVINAGHSRTITLVVNQDGPLIVQDIPLGAKGVIERIQLSTGLGVAEAIDMLKDQKPLSNLSLQAIESFLDKLFDSLTFTLGREGFLLTDPTVPVYLSGGLVCLEEFCESFQRRTPANVTKMNPFAKLIIPKGRFDIAELKQRAPLFSIALGLALHEEKELLPRVFS
jgi:type IV pilus assembly protein PilM